MQLEATPPTVIESYETFWDSDIRQSPVVLVPNEEPYTAFVNLTEEEFPDDPPHSCEPE